MCSAFTFDQYIIMDFMYSKLCKVLFGIVNHGEASIPLLPEHSSNTGKGVLACLRHGLYRESRRMTRLYFI